MASGADICSTEAIHSIMALYSQLACFAVKDRLHLTLGVSFTVFRGEPWDRHSASQPSQEALASHQRRCATGNGSDCCPKRPELTPGTAFSLPKRTTTLSSS